MGTAVDTAARPAARAAARAHARRAAPPAPDDGRPRAIETPGWVRPIGHVDGVSARGRLIFLAGQMGWDEHARIVAPDLVAQVRQTLRNVVHLLARAAAAPRHIACMTWYLAEHAEYERELPRIALAYEELIGREFPPMTIVAVASLLHRDARVAIDVTAVVDDAPATGAAPRPSRPRPRRAPASRPMTEPKGG